MGRFRAVRSRAFLSFHDIKHARPNIYFLFQLFSQNTSLYCEIYNVRFCSDAPKNSWISAPGPNWDSLCAWAFIAMQSLLCWVLRDAVIMKPTKTMQQITACKHTHRKTHSDITHGYTLWMHACSSTARECIRLSEHALLTHPSIIRLWHTHRHTV